MNEPLTTEQHDNDCEGTLLCSCELRAAQVRDAKDAARYRYLRERQPSDCITVETFGRPDGVMHLAGDELDQAIDRELSQ